ncbi:hypothetical protein M406DRAFT_44255 [Cryphonectria parasitica EP155]|uniref:Nucleoporin NUP53 n=1 Tax=Cryphonectria parasitica (strain ATCC 38755 / EP155) TaxID=660469 RepID=A0A9P4Y870_CRYP1|nr:uncharacterized protein M406DRAFT_44255 [Cryphonectria parasitica EP155]KAF3768759.1 hypothetical protein M406DRAFT_44255 [Cryphonectria parasitica EP155]
MAPLILHNVPDEELYIGEDGVQRPYAMIYPQQDGNPGNAGNVRNRRAVPESGAFGKSTRRSRSKTATPARREDPTIQSAQKVFAAYFEQQSFQPEETSDASASQKQRRQSTTAQLLPSAHVPTEIILRGFKDIDQQYAAINRYEHIAGRICEDYPRDPPYEIRRYKSELRDPAFVRRRALTPEERAKVNRADSGDHWVKVTFESQQAADAAIYASPQAILGHLVYAEYYKGMSPTRDEAVPDATTTAQGDEIPAGWRRSGFGGNRTAAELRSSFGEGGLPEKVIASDANELSPPHSHASSRTVESGTVGTGTSSSSTVIGAQHAQNGGALVPEAAAAASSSSSAGQSTYCRVIPSARKAVLLPAEQALLPQPSFSSRVLAQIPFLKWFSGAMIGSEVPRTAEGEFDWATASLYWKLICWLDLYFRLFSGDICSADKED